MALLDTSGHILNVGDKVKMNIPFIGSGDLDGVEITADGKNYWRYMNEHPYEVYTIVGFDFSNENEMSSEDLSEDFIRKYLSEEI